MSKDSKNSSINIGYLIAIIGILLALVGVLIAIVSWLIPFQPVGPSPFAQPPESLETPQEQQVAPPTPIPVPLVPDFLSISLESISEFSEPETNLELDPGINQLLGIPFENGWTSTTQCSYISTRPTRFEINTQISNPVSVYLLLQAGWGIQKYNGQQIGVVSLLFSDDDFNTTLKLGQNIRDWSVNSPNAVSTISSPTIQEAWRGNAPNGEVGRMDMLTIDIPAKYQQSTLRSIVIEDTTATTTGDFDPCIHLLAITVKHMR